MLWADIRTSSPPGVSKSSPPGPLSKDGEGEKSMGRMGPMGIEGLTENSLTPTLSRRERGEIRASYRGRRKAFKMRIQFLCSMVVLLFGGLVLLTGCGDFRGENLAGRLIAGTVEAEPALVEGLTGKERLHVLAQSPEGETVAVQSIQTLGFPADFCISEANVIAATGPIPATVTLSAYLTLDDVVVAEGSATDPVGWGQERVQIHLSAREEVLTGIQADTSEGNGEIRGTVVLSPQVEYVGQAKDILYIIVRDSDGKTLSVSQPYPNPSFPMEFVLKAGETMMGTIPEGQEVFLIARLDRDGNAFSSPGDLEGAVTRGAVRLGETGAEILLDRVIEKQ